MLSLTLFTLALQVTAVPRPPLSRICARNLSGDQKLDLLREADSKTRPLRSREERRKYFSNGVSQLLNQTFTPFLIDFSNSVAKKTPTAIRRYTKVYARARQLQPIVIDSAKDVPKGLYGRFSTEVTWSDFGVGPDNGGPTEMIAPATEFNSAIMVRLARAARVTEVYAGTYLTRRREKETFDGSYDLLRRFTFTKNKYHSAMKAATESVIRAIAMLTAEPVGDLSAEELLTLVTTKTDLRPSLVDQLAMILPPRLLGRFGGQAYVTGALIFDGRELKFSPKFRNVLTEFRREVEPEYRDHEFGFGCPVAQAIRGAECSGLQKYVDAMLRIYEAQLGMINAP